METQLQLIDFQILFELNLILKSQSSRFKISILLMNLIATSVSGILKFLQKKLVSVTKMIFLIPPELIELTIMGFIAWRLSSSQRSLQESRPNIVLQSSSSLQSQNIKPKKQAFPFTKRGLINLGNTCYFNSALQCLLKTIELYQACLKSKVAQEGKFKPVFLNFCKEMLQETREPFNPKQIHRAMSDYSPLFSDYAQHDAGEALGTMLSMIHREMNEVPKKEIVKIDERLRKDEKDSQELLQQSIKKDQKRQKSIVDDFIYGRYRVVYQCLNPVCKEKYILFQKFHAILLPIPNKANALALSHCFEAFCEPSFMKGKNKFFCDRCQSEQDTQKDMTIYQVNKILLVFLKRFTDKAKINSSIEIPLKIDDAYMKSSRKVGEYSLYGMIVHSGGLNSGHYIAVCWDEKNGWVVFNDSRTRQISEEQARKMGREAYVLAYRKVE